MVISKEKGELKLLEIMRSGENSRRTYFLFIVYHIVGTLGVTDSPGSVQPYYIRS